MEDGANEVAELEDPEAQRQVADLVEAGGLNRSQAIEAVREAARATGKGGGGPPPARNARRPGPSGRPRPG